MSRRMRPRRLDSFCHSLYLRRARMRHRAQCLGGVIITLSLLGKASGQVSAQPLPEVELSFTRGPGAQSCPGDRAMHDALLVQIGRDPIVPVASTKVVVRISRRGDVFLGEMERLDPAGRRLWSHAPMRDSDCARLIELMGLSISIEIDPLGGPAPPPPPPESPAPASASATPSATPFVSVSFPVAPPSSARDEPADRAARADSGDPMPFRAGARAALVLGSMPSPNLGVAVDLGVRFSSVSLSLEGRAVLPAEREVDAGKGVATSLLTLALAPCVHMDVALVCVLAEAGSLRASGKRVDHPANADALYLAGGGRLGLEIPVFQHLAARLSADLTGTLRPATFHLAGQEVWTAPPVAAALGGGVVAIF